VTEQRLAPQVEPNALTVVDKVTLAQHTVQPTTSGCTVPVLGRLAAAGNTVWALQRNSSPRGCADSSSDSIVMLPPGSATMSTVATVHAPTALLADGSHVFWSQADGTYRLARALPATPERLGPVLADDLATDGTTLFGIWSIGRPPYAWAIGAPGQSSIVFTAAPGQAIVGIAADATHLYLGGDGILRMAHDGSAQQTITPADVRAGSPAVDDAFVYYAAGGSLMAACK
jgi:hypothetical protein